MNLGGILGPVLLSAPGLSRLGAVAAAAYGVLLGLVVSMMGAVLIMMIIAAAAIVMRVAAAGAQAFRKKGGLVPAAKKGMDCGLRS
jgi:hypothetical protein